MTSSGRSTRILEDPSCSPIPRLQARLVKALVSILISSVTDGEELLNDKLIMNAQSCSRTTTQHFPDRAAFSNDQ